MVYSRNDKKDIWNGYLNEIRHDAIARQKQVTPTDADIELLGRMIYYVMSFAKAARTYGLLAVEEEALHLDLENEAEAILHEAAELIVDGSSPECVAEILSNYYWIIQPEGYATTAAYIGIRGALLVQEDVNPYSVQLIAGSMLPVKIREKCIEVCRNYEAQKQKKQDEAAKVYFETDFSRSEALEIREALDWLERELSYMTDREIQRLLREVDNNYLVPVLVIHSLKRMRDILRTMTHSIILEQEQILWAEPWRMRVGDI